MSNTSAGSGPSLAPYYLILFGMSAGLGGIVALLAEMRNELGFSETGIGLTIGAGFGMGFVASLVMGPRADRGQAPRMLRWALVIGILALAVMAVGDQLWHYVVGRAVFGFALGTGGPAARRTIIVADPDNLGRNMGRMGAFDVGGFMVAPLVAASVSALWGFRATFWVFAGFLLLLLPAALRARPDTALKDETARRPYDLLRIRRLIGAFCIVAAYFVFIGTFESVWILELDLRGASQTTIGLALTLVALPIGLLSPWGGVLAQRYGARRWTLLVLGSLSVIITFYGVVPGVWGLVILTAATSVIEGIGFPAGPMLVSAAVPQDRQAAAQGLMTAVEVATGAVFSIVGALVYDRHGDTAAWGMAAVVMALLLAVGFVLTRPEDRSRVRPGTPVEPIRRLYE